MKNVFKPEHGNGYQYDANRKYNKRIQAAAIARCWKARKTGLKPSRRDMQIAAGHEPTDI
jgi:hypothetical protein